MWQQFIEEHADSTPFAFLSVAVDVDPSRPRPFAEGYTFPTVVDSAGLLGRIFDFDVVPNCVFLDEDGIIRFIHIGGFEVARPEMVEQVEALLRADFAHGEQPRLVVQEPLDIEVLQAEIAHQPQEPSLHFALGEVLIQAGRHAEAATAFRRASDLDPADWSARFALGTALYQGGYTTGALSWWRSALERDPKNFTVRKQIWWVEHPEKFYPTIDFDWQREQLKIEGYVP